MEIVWTEFPSMGSWETLVPPTRTLLQRLMGILLDSGRGQERSLVCYFSDIFVLRANRVGQFYDH